MNRAPYPFVFFAHGPWGYPDEIEHVHVSLVFAEDVPTELRAAIESSAPGPVDSFRWPLASLMTFGPPPEQRFDAAVRAYRENDDVTSRAYVQRFSDALDAWLLATHARAPLTTVLGWFGDPRRDAWARWSASVGLERALPRLLTLRRDARAASDAALNVELARCTYEVIAHCFDGYEPADISAAEYALVKDTLSSIHGLDARLDDNVRRLYLGIAVESLPTR